MTRFGVSEKKQKTLEERMKRSGIREKDITERFIRSSGRGGQHVNKTDTCVYLKHRPTGVEVKCGRERSQSLNRFFARRILTEKIEKAVNKEISEEKKRIAKIRKQKRKRSKRAKEKIMEEKKKQSEKKQLRKPVNADE